MPNTFGHPAVHSGGIYAVAIATPGITYDLLRRVAAVLPASPPNRAISTSQMVGVVRASNSVCPWDNGVMAKYSAEVSMESPVAIPRLVSARRISGKS